MTHQTADISTEFNEFAAPLVDSGQYADTREVLHAAMDALRRENMTEEEEDRILEALAEEGEASGIAEGDVMADLRREFGLPPSVKR